MGVSFCKGGSSGIIIQTNRRVALRIGGNNEGVTSMLGGNKMGVTANYDWDWEKIKIVTHCE